MPRPSGSVMDGERERSESEGLLSHPGSCPTTRDELKQETNTYSGNEMHWSKFFFYT